MLHVYRLLAEVFPDAEPWYDGNHVITKIGTRWYDITSEVIPGPNHQPMKSGLFEFSRAAFWEPGEVGGPVLDEAVEALTAGASLTPAQSAKARDILGPMFLRFMRFVRV